MPKVQLTRVTGLSDEPEPKLSPVAVMVWNAISEDLRLRPGDVINRKQIWHRAIKYGLRNGTEVEDGLVELGGAGLLAIAEDQVATLTDDGYRKIHGG